MIKMKFRKYTLTDPTSTSSHLLSFMAWYFPFIDEPLIIKYRQRIYQTPSTQKRYRFAEDFFVTTDCPQCPKNCCKRNWALAVGFESVWQDREEILKNFHAKKHYLYLNDKRTAYYIGKTGYACKFQQERKCLVWDSALTIRKRPMGCHIYPMKWHWDEQNSTVVFSRSGACNFRKSYSPQDLECDLNSLDKMCKEVELLGFKPNYEPQKRLKASFSELKI
jgi:Fe-S-cluster containining protein